MWGIMSVIANFILGTISSQMADRGLANVLRVETLKHGTDFFSYLNIRMVGGLPKYESFSSKSLNKSSKDSSNYFYIFKENISFGKSLVFSRIHVTSSSMKSLQKQFPSDSFLAKSLMLLGAAINFIATPTINFRYRKEEITGRFENDPEYRIEESVESSVAYKTKEKVENWRIGFIGSILVGVNASWLNRAKENLWQLLKGVIQLIGAAFLTWYAGNSIRTVSFVAGVILA